MRPKRSDKSVKGAGATFRQDGAALLLILLIAITIGLTLLFSSPFTGGTFLRQQTSQDAMLTAKSALIGYAASYPEQVNPSRVWGYLPCPDANNDGTQDTNFALCPSGGSGNVFGRLPHRELGLADLRDASTECLWYAVSGTHKLTNDSSPLNWDLRGNIRVERSNGSVLADPNDPNDPSGGAVAAVFAPGPALGNQPRSGGPGPCAGDATNAVNSWIDDPTYGPIVNGALVVRQGDPGSATNNDQIAWITAKELWDTIGRRKDVYAKTDAMLTQVRNCLNGQSTLPLATGMVDSGAADPKQHAKATGLTLPSCGLSAFNLDLWENWRDQVRYVRCKTAGVNCLTVNGTACEGALLLGGRHVAGRPRTSGEASQVSSYFEEPNATSLTGAGTTFATSATPYGPSNPAGDTAYCLDSLASAPITFASPVVTAVASTTNLATFNSATQILTLGADGINSEDVGGDFGQLFGCAWVGSPVSLGNGFRAVFRYAILRRGPGFTFTVADANPSINPSASMCGGGGRFLAYAGTPNQVGVASIKPPKLAVEVDTEITLDDRNDPNDNHIAPAFWGARASLDDDNAHPPGGVADTLGDPSNPASFYSDSLIRELDREHAVRVELVANAADYNAGTGTATMTLKVWFKGSVASLPTGFLNTTVDYPISNPSDPPNLTYSFSVTDFLPGVRALGSLRFGFTGSAGIGDQLLRITNLEIRSR